MKTETFVDIKPGEVIQVLDLAEAKSIETKWMNTFCKNKTGVDTKAYKWHIFSSGRYDAQEGDHAMNEYLKHLGYL